MQSCEYDSLSSFIFFYQEATGSIDFNYSVYPVPEEYGGYPHQTKLVEPESTSSYMAFEWA